MFHEGEVSIYIRSASEYAYVIHMNTHIPLYIYEVYTCNIIRLFLASSDKWPRSKVPTRVVILHAYNTHI